MPRSELIADWVRHAYASVRPADESSFELTVRVVDESEGRALNRQFREVDRATNVLAFPAGEDEYAAARGDAGARPLGDLVICGAVVRREAQEQGKTHADHWCHLLVHGTLHLLGYDHEDDRQAAEMESLETRILAELGIEDPYRDR
jgi:probable rRNA maturation factor